MVNLKVVATSSCISTWTSSQLVRGFATACCFGAAVRLSSCNGWEGLLLLRLQWSRSGPTWIVNTSHQPLETEAQTHRSCDLQDRRKSQLHGLRGAPLPSMNKAPSVKQNAGRAVVADWDVAPLESPMLSFGPIHLRSRQSNQTSDQWLAAVLQLAIAIFPSFATRAASGPSGANSASYFMHVKCIFQTHNPVRVTDCSECFTSRLKTPLFAVAARSRAFIAVLGLLHKQKLKN